MDKLYSKYYKEIKAWNWKTLKEEAFNNVEKDYEGNKIGSVYLGTVFSLMPSGKFYMPWACSNVTEEEAEKDQMFTEALEKVAEENGMFIFSGEGDPCDIFAGVSIE